MSAEERKEFDSKRVNFMYPRKHQTNLNEEQKKVQRKKSYDKYYLKKYGEFKRDPNRVKIKDMTPEQKKEHNRAARKRWEEKVGIEEANKIRLKAVKKWKERNTNHIQEYQREYQKTYVRKSSNDQQKTKEKNL